MTENYIFLKQLILRMMVCLKIWGFWNSFSYKIVLKTFYIFFGLLLLKMANAMEFSKSEINSKGGRNLQFKFPALFMKKMEYICLLFLYKFQLTRPLKFWFVHFRLNKYRIFTRERSSKGLLFTLLFFFLLFLLFFLLFLLLG
jgi:hypothetical protein